jgi:methylated-DNA-protein-cysteine methyltransferase-like protein
VSVTKEALIAVLEAIPPGTVVSYGEVARACGMPRGARVIGWLIASVPLTTPWHRVVNRDGYLTIRNRNVDALLQAERLRNEGIEIQETAQGFRVLSTLGSLQ